MAEHFDQLLDEASHDQLSRTSYQDSQVSSAALTERSPRRAQEFSDDDVGPGPPSSASKLAEPTVQREEPAASSSSMPPRPLLQTKL